VAFQWHGKRRSKETSYRLEIASEAGFQNVLVKTNSLQSNRLTLDLAALSLPQAKVWWRIVTVGPNGETVPDVPAACFTLASDTAAQRLPPQIKLGPNAEVVIHSLRAGEQPKFGELLSDKFDSRTEEGAKVNGHDQRIMYAVPCWPEEDFTVAVRFRVEEMPRGRIGQVFSGWAAGMDDPLRLVIDNGKLFARIEGSGGAGTSGAAIEPGRWYYTAAVKHGGSLKLFLDGKEVAVSAAPQFITTSARDCALGGNPHFGGNEFLAATFADFGLWARGLSGEEVRRLAETR
jgi:hypothetical protein